MRRVVNRAHLSDGTIQDLRYWLAQPIQARLAAVETLRQQYMQTLPHDDTRLQRVCRITQLQRR